MRAKHIRLRFLVPVIVLIVGLLSAFGAAAEPVVITVFYADGSHGYPRWAQAGVDQFNAANPHIQAEVVAGNIDRLVTLIAGGMAPDVIHGPGDRYIPEWAYNGMIQPLSPFLADDPDVLDGIIPTILPILTWNDQLYGLPRNWAVGGIISDVELFQERGVALPDANWTQEEMLAIARRMTYDSSGDGDVDVFGFTEAYGSAHRFPSWVWSSGGDLWNSDMTESGFDTPETLEGLRFYERLMFTEEVSPYPHGGSADRVALWNRKSLGLAHELAQSIGVVAEQRPTFRSHISPLPVGAGGADAARHIAVIDYLTLYSETPHPNEAWEVLRYLISPEGIMAGMDLTPAMGYQTTLSPHLTQLQEQLATRTYEENPFEWINLAQTMRGTSVSHPVLGTTYVNTVINEHLGRVRRGEVPMSAAAADAARILNSAVEQLLDQGASW